MGHKIGSAVKIVKDAKKDEKKKDEKKKEEVEEMTILTEPAKKGELTIFVVKKIGKPGDKIMVDGEMNEVAPDAKEKDAKEPDAAGKTGVEIKLLLPLEADHAVGGIVKVLKADEKKEEKKKEEKKKEAEESTVLTEPAKKGDLSIFVEKKIGKPGDKIMIEAEISEVGPDAKDGKEPPEAAKKGVEIKLILPLEADH